MIVISLAAIVALAVICLAIEHAYMVQKKRARIARGRYKEGQAILAEMDLAHQREVEHLRRDLHLAESVLSKERQLKHGFKRSCEKLKTELDDKCDEIESLRAALESANGTIREMMEDRASGGAGLSAATESLSRAARAFREAAGCTVNGNDYISRHKVERFIENGLNNPDKKKAFGHDAVEILTEVHYMEPADVRPVRPCDGCPFCVCEKHGVICPSDPDFRCDTRGGDT